MPRAITHGRELRRAELAGHTLVESSYEPEAELEAHVHAHPYLVLVLDGTFRERSRGTTHACGPGTVMIRPAGTRHSDRFGGRGTRCMVLGVGSETESAPAFAEVRHDPPGPVVSVAARMYAELRDTDAASGMIVDGLVRELAGIVTRYATRSVEPPPFWLERARERLREECFAPPLVRELAAEAAVHPDHLSRSFRRHFGSLPGEYVRSIRLAWAADRLLEDDAPVASIAQRAGFADQSHFTRAFKKRFGIPPGRYRERRRR